MSPEITTTFLTSYIQSLGEESAEGRFGFDSIIYQLALSKGLSPTRLASYREGDGKMPVPKKESEHGVDAAFLTPSGEELWIFVLKDERLTYKNWTSHSFNTDLWRASNQDLSTPKYLGIKKVVLVLAYNKDENEEGVEEFNRFAESRGTQMGNNGSLRYERWNLTDISEKVRDQLLNPSLLPDKFFRSFTYICWQVGDFPHGSAHWNDILIPDWRDFLQNVLGNGADERVVRLVSVALIIIRNYGKSQQSSETGWIELAEWAAIAVWNVGKESNLPAVRNAVFELWAGFYLEEVFLFYQKYSSHLATEHSLEQGTGSSFQSVTSSFIAYWHLARLGILAMGIHELISVKEHDSNKILWSKIGDVTTWIIQLLNANSSSTLRPFLDIHHIQLFLVWRVLIIQRRNDDISGIFRALLERLVFRRSSRTPLRLIDQSNSLDAVLDHIATGQPLSEGYGRSSYLILMIFELLLTQPDRHGEVVIKQFYRHFILGKDDFGATMGFNERVELYGWTCSPEWAQKIFLGAAEDGVSILVDLGEDDSQVPERLKEYIRESERAYPFEFSVGLPRSVFVLASLLHRSPLPSAFWRIFLRPALESNNSNGSR